MRVLNYLFVVFSCFIALTMAGCGGASGSGDGGSNDPPAGKVFVRIRFFRNQGSGSPLLLAQQESLADKNPASVTSELRANLDSQLGAGSVVPNGTFTCDWLFYTGGPFSQLYLNPIVVVDRVLQNNDYESQTQAFLQSNLTPSTKRVFQDFFTN